MGSHDVLTETCCQLCINDYIYVLFDWIPYFIILYYYAMYYTTTTLCNSYNQTLQIYVA